MSQTVRYGVIGGGMMGREHIRFIRLVPDAEVVAIADPHPASREAALADAEPDVAIFADHRDLLSEATVDALVIATPNHTHAAVLADVFQTDTPVMVEKPLCATVEDCRAVVAAAARHGGLFWVAMEYRYIPPVARLIDEVRGGAVGELRMLAIREHRYPFLSKVGDWNRFVSSSGGTLVEKCCHFFDLMRLITEARPVRVYGSGGQDVNHLDERYDGRIPDMLDNAYVIVDFEGGSRALLDLCMFAEASKDEHEIAATGDGGKIECTVPSSKLIIGRRPAREVEVLHIPVEDELLAAGAHHGSTYYEHLAFLSALRNDTPPEVSGHDGLMAVVMGAAAERSIAERRPVEIREFGL